MPKASRVGETSTNTSAATLTLGGAISGFRTVASKHSVGETGIELVISDAAGNWEEGVFNFTSAGPTVMTRTATLSSSNADGPVTFPPGSKTVQETASATFLNQLSGVRSVAFSSALSFAFQGETYMPQYNMSGPLAFTIAGGVTKGAYIIGQIVGDGTNTPTFDASIKDSGGGTTYDVRSGYPNKIYFWYDGFDYQRQYGQVANVTPVPTPATALTMTGPTNGVVSQPSTAFSIAANGTLAGTVIWTPAEAGTGATGTFTPTSGTTPGSFTYTPGSTGAKTISITNNGGLTNPTPITYTVAAAATVPATMSAPVATAGDTTASIAFTAPSNGGSAITSYTITPFIGATAQTAQNTTTLTSPYTATGLTNGSAYTFKIHANNVIGPGVDSPASNSVTPAAVATFPRMVENPQTSGLLHYIESGTGPYSYTRTGAANYPTNTLLEYINQSFGTGDGEIVLRQETFERLLYGFTALATVPADDVEAGPTNLTYSVWTSSGNWIPYAGSTALTPTNTVAIANPGGVKANGDWARFKRVGSTMTFAVSKNLGGTWTNVYSWTGIPTTALHIAVGTNKIDFTLLSSLGLV